MNPGPSIGRPRFVTLDDALAWHEISLVQYGGAPGIRDIGLLQSALAQPSQGFGGQLAHTFPFEMAAAYAYHIAKNHPFFDGNKRTSLMCAGAFLRMNGWDLISEGTEAADAVISLVEGRLSKANFATWLQEHCRQRPMMELRDFFQAVDLEQIAAMLSGFLASPDTSERRATVEDAAVAVPLVSSLRRLSGVESSKGNAIGAENAAYAAMLLVCLYRIAEDMGYEW